MLIFTLSCEDDMEDKVTLDISKVTGGTMANLSQSSYILTYAEANNNFEMITWDSTDYGYQTSITYILQIDVDGANFSNAINLETTTELYAEINIEDLNTVLVEDLSQTPEEAASVQFRVVSTIISSVDLDSVFSSPISVDITPYDPDIPPIYLIGGLEGWNADNAIELPSVSPLVYSGFIDLEPDSVFRLFETKDMESEVQWGYSYFTSVPIELVDNEDAADNFKFVDTVKATYAITVDLNAKSIVLEIQLYPSTFFIIGGDQGWNLDDPLALRHKGGGVFEGIETFTNGNEWRFFETPSWGGVQWNYNTFADGTIDENLTGPNGGDANFLFTGTTGIYKITVSTLDLTITMETAEAPTMFRVGGFNSWAWDESMTWIRGEKFTVTSELVAGQEWRFFPDDGNWGNTVDYTYFEDVPSDLWSGPNGGDKNFLDLVSGTYTITIDVVQGIITGEPQ